MNKNKRTSKEPILSTQPMLQRQKAQKNIIHVRQRSQEFLEKANLKSMRQNSLTIQDIIQDLTERTGIIFKAYNNEIWMPVSTKSIKTLKKKEKLIVRLVKNGKIIFDGIGTLLQGDDKQLKISVKPLEQKNKFDTFKFLYYDPCKTKCIMKLTKNKEFEPRIPSEQRQNNIEKELFESIKKTLDDEIHIEKEYKKETDEKRKKELIKQLENIEKIRNLKKITRDKVFSQRIQREKEQTDLHTLGFRYDDNYDIHAIVFKRM